METTILKSFEKIKQDKKIHININNDTISMLAQIAGAATYHSGGKITFSCVIAAAIKQLHGKVMDELSGKQIGASTVSTIQYISHVGRKQFYVDEATTTKIHQIIGAASFQLKRRVKLSDVVNTAIIAFHKEVMAKLPFVEL